MTGNFRTTFGLVATDSTFLIFSEREKIFQFLSLKLTKSIDLSSSLSTRLKYWVIKIPAEAGISGNYARFFLITTFAFLAPFVASLFKCFQLLLSSFWRAAISAGAAFSATAYFLSAAFTTL